MDLNSSHLATYRAEATEQLAMVEETILAIEVSPSDTEAINRLFRIFHTIKGSGSMFGFEKLAHFTHRVETMLDQLRKGLIPVSRELVSLVLASKDHISDLLSHPERNPDEALVARLCSFAPAGEPPPPSHPLPVAAPLPILAGRKTFGIQFTPTPAQFAQGLDPLSLLRELRRLGSCRVCLQVEKVPLLEQLDPEQCHLSWAIELTTDHGVNAVRDVFIFVEDAASIEIRELLPTAATPSAPVVEIKTVEAPPVAPPAPREGLQTRTQTLTDASVRVPSPRLDRLVNLVGELVINHSRLQQISGRAGLPELNTTVEDLERLVSELRDTVLGIRMTPIGTSFGRFRRLVRDLSSELGKEIDLVTEGEDTELDKNILDQLVDPLVHLLRNAIDHGLDLPAERERQGKPRRGTLRLVASHEGAHVCLRIEDDGRGLDLEAIRRKAVENGLLAPESKPSELELHNLLFRPGFSTATKVTAISGRGVGMDVVKRQVDALRGRVSIASAPGRGTSVLLTLPLTLAIIDGLLLELGGENYILPMSVVNENVEVCDRECATGNGRNLISVRGDLIPYISLRELFDTPGQRPQIERIVIVQAGHERVGLVVDRIQGAHQTVIQSLGRFYRECPGFSGATILGEGQVALILDVAGLVRMAGSELPAGDLQTATQGGRSHG